MNMKSVLSSTKLFRLIESFTCNNLASTGKHPLIPSSASLKRVFRVLEHLKLVETTHLSWILLNMV
jgi:hypothetical protein